MTIIHDSKIEAPELFYSGRKPVSPIQLDITNPLVYGLKYCFLLRQSPENLVPNGLKASTVGFPYIETGIKPTTSDYVTTDDSPYYGEMTMIAGCTTDSVPISGPESDIVNKFKMGTMSWDHTSASFRGAWAINDGSWKSTTFNISNTGYYNLAGTTKSGGTMASYKNGILQGSQSINNVADSTRFIVIGRNSELINAAFPGTIDYTYVFNRELTPLEILKFNQNPYRIFIPK